MNNYISDDNDEAPILSKLKYKVDSIRKQEKRQLKNTITDDFSKGNVRNQLCPECGKKLKKCKCFKTDKYKSVLEDIV